MKQYYVALSVLSVGLLIGCEQNGQPADKAIDSAVKPVPSQTEQEVRVDKIFAHLDTQETPGCALSVIKHGEVIYKRGYGMANLEHNIPITPSSVFHIASVSKQFTVFSVALLVEEGKVSWDDDIYQYFPDMPDYGHTITLRHLAHNISGIRDQWELLMMAGWRWEADLVTQRDAMRMITRQQSLNFTPGDQYLYSNSNFTLLAEVVHKVTGQTLRRFAEERIFKPLNMKHTHFHDDHEMIVKNRADGYIKLDDQRGYKISNPDFAIVGATSLFTTVEDMAKWDRNFYTQQVGDKIAVPEIGVRGVLNDGAETDYARAMIHGTHQGLPTLGHSGADAGYRTQFIRYPEQEFSFAVFCNSPTTSPVELAEQVAEVYLEDQMSPAQPENNEPRSVAMSDAQLKAFEGVYKPVYSDHPAIVTFKDGTLEMDLTYFTLELVPLGGNQFSGVSPYGTAQIEFVSAESNNDMTLQMVFKMAHTVAPRLAKTRAPNKDNKEYVGHFYSKELDTDYTISVTDGGKLTLSFANYENLELKALYDGGFTFTDSFPHFLMFTRGSDNTVDGFTLSGWRAWKVGAKKIK